MVVDVVFVEYDLSFFFYENPAEHHRRYRSIRELCQSLACGECGIQSFVYIFNVTSFLQNIILSIIWKLGFVFNQYLHCKRTMCHKNMHGFDYCRVTMN